MTALLYNKVYYLSTLSLRTPTFLMYLLFCAVLSLLASTSAKTVPVVVGGSGLTFEPDHVDNAVTGDVIVFQFQTSGHTATQSSFDAPCSPLASGFDSGMCVASCDLMLALLTTFCFTGYPHQTPIM
jgi:plastocyanin